MATTLNSTINIGAIGTFTDDTQKTTQTQRINYAYTKTTTNGTALANDCDLYFEDEVTGAGATVTYTFDDASLSDEFGNSLTFVRIKAILIENANAVFGATIGGTLQTAGNLPSKLEPNGVVFVSEFTTIGIPTSTADVLQYTTLLSGVTVRTRVWGASA